jgi:dolichyl-phosphate-mannose--protein O-mannosyl transferase
MAGKFKFTKSGIIISIIIICYFFSGLFTLGTFNKPVNYFYAEKQNTVDNIQVVVLLDYKENQTVKELWINTGAVEVKEGGSASISIKYAYSATSSGTTLGTSVIKNAGDVDSNLFNWSMLYTNMSVTESYKYFFFTFNNDMQVNELVFLDKDGNKISASIVDSTKEEGYISPLFDEQDTFTTSVNFLNTVSQNESYTLSSAVNFINSRGYIVDGEANALGVQIIALGVTIFGANTIGLRIMPFLFSTAIIILLYFIGKKLFNKKWLAILLSGIFVLSGFAFSVGRTGSVIPIFTFFMLISLMFMYEFYTTAIIKNSIKPTVKCLLLSALFFIIAFGISSMALFGLIGLIALFITAVIRQKKLYNKTINKSDDEKTIIKLKNNFNYKTKVNYLLFIASFIIAPVLFITIFYIPFFNTLSISYENTNFFSVIIKDITYFFSFERTTLFSAGNKSSFISWLFNYRTTVLFADTAYSGKEVVAAIFNSVTALCAFISLIFIVVFIIVYSISREVTKKDNEFITANFKQIIFLIIGLICFVVPFAFIKSQCNSYFYIGSIFYTAFICIFLNKMDIDFQDKKIFTKIKGGIAITHFTAIIIVSLIFINFLMVMPLYFGIPVSLKFESVLYWITNFKPSSFIR